MIVVHVRVDRKGPICFRSSETKRASVLLRSVHCVEGFGYGHGSDGYSGKTATFFLVVSFHLAACHSRSES